MARRSTPPPSYRKCRIHGNLRAVTTLNDSVTGQRRTIYLGLYGSPESREKYARLLAQWETCGRRLPGAGDSRITLTISGPTITQLCHAFWVAIQGQYSHQQASHFKACIRLLKGFYGEMPVKDFGPKALRLLRNQMICGGDGRRLWTRNYINRQIGLLRQIFRWGVSHEMIPVSILETLRTVEPLKRGRSDAIETEPIRPVSENLLVATFTHLNRQVRAVVELQILTGARPAELLVLRPCDLLTGEHADVWIVRLDHHKTAYRGRDRTIYLGPQAQAIIRPFLANRPTTAYLFSPVEAEQERREALHKARKTPLSYGNRPGTNKSESPKRPPRDRYDTASYRRAIQYACDRAFPQPDGLDADAIKAWQKAHRWHPYQLRHNAATSLRREFGLEAAQLILGHSSAQITDAVYADRDREKILGIVQKIG